jgi:hypothetical protein
LVLPILGERSGMRYYEASSIIDAEAVRAVLRVESGG